MLVQRLAIASGPQALAGYRLDKGAREESGSIVLPRGGMAASNSFFHSYFESFHCRHAPLIRPEYRFRLHGSVRLRFIRKKSGQPAQQILEKGLEAAGTDRLLVVALPEHMTNQCTKSRIYFELTGVAEHSVFYGAELHDQAKTHQVCLHIVVCTYRRENELGEMVSGILQDTALRLKGIRLWIIDHGGTISGSRFPDPRVRVLAGRNLGGAGGFNRGLASALASKATHVLLLDDDAQVNPECILRVITCYERAGEDVAFAGVLLNAQNPSRIVESGALVFPSEERQRHPLRVIPLGNGLDVSNQETVDWFADSHVIDYGGFWFFALPTGLVRKAGLLLPFFIKADDVEYGLRLTRRFGARVLVLPGVAVVHPAFDQEFNLLKRYFWVRNMLVTGAIHDPNFGRTAPSFLIIEGVRELSRGRWGYVAALVHGIRDFLKGPALEIDLVVDRKRADLEGTGGQAGSGWSLHRIGLIFRLGGQLMVSSLILTCRIKSACALWKSKAQRLSEREYWHSRLDRYEENG